MIQRISVKKEVQKEHDQGKMVLDIPCQTLRIDERQQVMIDETPGVWGLFCQDTESIFERSQGAEPSIPFAQCSPYCRWQVQKNKPSEAQCEQGAKKDEKDKRGVKQHDEIRCIRKDHNLAPPDISIICPVMNAASSDARKRAHLATSSGVATRPRG